MVEPDVPAEFMTVTSTVPADDAGTVTVMELLELTVNDVAATVPNLTCVTFVKFVPMIEIVLPPDVDPELADRLVTAGVITGVVNISLSAEFGADVP